MFSPTAKKALATTLAGAAIVSSLGASAARAQSGSDAAGTPCVSPPPSLLAASAAEEYAKLRAACASLTSASQPVAHESTETGGFDAPSAAIGAASGTGVVILLLAAGGLARSSQTRRQRHAST